MKHLLLSSLWLCLMVSGLRAQPLPPKREFRAVWIASVANIDWPSRKGLPVGQQQDEFSQLLDYHRNSGMNAIIMQVRPATDAFYYSHREPWSEWLTGRQGLMPSPFYDPLQFMIEETHRRGMEFHAWLNPYRAVYDADAGLVSENHITNLKPEWFVRYGKNKVFNPGIPEVRDYITEIVIDIVRRYDVDAIHFDDYFYPYQIADVKFDDAQTFATYGQGFSSIDDWRRSNVNKLIEAIAKGIKESKSYVKFGISPFGVWRNRTQDPTGSATQAGQTSYDHLYADVRMWLQKGWIDYVAPQVYFSMGFDKVPYGVLTDWWTRNSYGRHLYIGQATYKIKDNSDPNWNNLAEMPNQLRYNRQQKNVHGSIYFSSKSLVRNQGNFRDSLRKEFYRLPALVPAMPWKDNTPPPPPAMLEATTAANGVWLRWQKSAPQQPSDAAYFVVYRFGHDDPINLDNPANIVAISRDKSNFVIDTNLPASGRYKYVVTALDRLHNESKASAPLFIDYRERGSWYGFANVLYRHYIRNNKKVQ